jgi:hypothetical protein
MGMCVHEPLCVMGMCVHESLCECQSDTCTELLALKDKKTKERLMYTHTHTSLSYACTELLALQDKFFQCTYAMEHFAESQRLEIRRLRALVAQQEVPVPQ